MEVNESSNGGRLPNVIRKYRLKKGCVLATKLTISALLLWLVISRTDLEKLKSFITNLSWMNVAAAIIIIEIQTVVLAWRWRRIVCMLGGDLTFILATRMTFLGVFMNQVLPTSIGGDVIRVWSLQRLGVSAGLSLLSVIIERITGLLALSIIITIFVPVIWKKISDPLLQTILISTSPLILMVLLAGSFVDKLPTALIPRRFASITTSVSSNIRRLSGRPMDLFEIMGLGIIASLSGLYAAYILGCGIGIDVGFSAIITLVGSAILFSVLPISLGGWGVREAAMISLLNIVGVSADKALLLSMLFGIVLMLASLPGGLTWWAGSSMPFASTYNPVKKDASVSKINK